MTDLFGDAGFWPAFPLLAAVTAAASLARGFSGFGAALIFVPLASTILGPKVAVPVLLVVDGFMTAGMIPAATRSASRREVVTMALGTLGGVPLGAWVLSATDPMALRWGISGMAGLMLVLLVSGWRYHGRPRAALTVLVGAISGVFSGAAQIGGPPVVAYWLGGVAPAAIVRANIILFFAISTVVSAASYVWGGLISQQVVLVAAVMAPVYGLGAWLGARMFALASEGTFRRICLCMILVATIVSLPALDGWLRGH